MKLSSKNIALIGTLTILLAGGLILARPSLSQPPLCRDRCNYTTSCNTFCANDQGRRSTCGDYGVCAPTPTPFPTSTPPPPPVGCWAFQFEGGHPFPNPASSGSTMRESMNLLVLGNDQQIYPATIRSSVYNVLGQKIYERSEPHASAPSFNMVVWNVGSVASGVYLIQVRAESSICGNSEWDTYEVTILN